MHVIPCCDGPCDICGRRIRDGGMQGHLDEQHPSTEPKSNYASADGSEAVARYDAARAELVRPELPKRATD